MTCGLRNRSRRIGGLALGCIGWLLLAVSPSTAATVVLQNDSIVDFGTAVIQVGFITDERAAAWLTSTCNGDLVAVQVLWLSLTGSQPQVIGHSISVSEAGAFPELGAELKNLPAPLMTDGLFNEVAIVPAIPLSAGETIVVDFHFEQPPELIGPSVVTDNNGCQNGRNAIFAIPGGWLDACAVPLSGDFAIRAVVDCPDNSIFLDGFEAGDTSAWTDAVP